MDILITNLGLPTEDEQVNITILSDGSVIEHFRNESGKWSSYKSGGVEAIEIPEHGDLIDRDALANSIPEAEPHGFENCEKCTCMTKDEMVEIILDAVVVLERTT